MGVPEDSNFPLLGVWASPSHLAQSGVATKMDSVVYFCLIGLDIDFDDVDGQHVIEVHLENLQKQQLAWKPNYYNSITCAFFKVNDNQHVNLSQN